MRQTLNHSKSVRSGSANFFVSALNNTLPSWAHGDFLRRLTDEPTSYWANAEVRVFEFAPNAVTTDACPLVFVDHVEKGDWKGTASSTGVAHTSDLSSMEERVRQIQASVMSQTSELEQLDKMLAAAEQKHVHLKSQMGSSDPSA